MQNFTPTGKSRFLVSNRVFWAAVVLVAASILSRQSGVAGPTAAVSQEIKTKRLTVVDDNGLPSVTISAVEGGSVNVGTYGKKGSVSLMMTSTGPAIVFFGKGGKAGDMRIINASPELDVPQPSLPNP